MAARCRAGAAPDFAQADAGLCDHLGAHQAAVSHGIVQGEGLQRVLVVNQNHVRYLLQAVQQHVVLVCTAWRRGGATGL